MHHQLKRRTSILAAILIGGASVALSEAPAAPAVCKAGELVDSLSTDSDVYKLSESKDPAQVPYGVEAAALLRKWIGKQDSAGEEGGTPVGDRADMASAVFRQCASNGAAGAHLLVGAIEATSEFSRSSRKQARKHFEVAVEKGIRIGYIGSAAASYQLGDERRAKQSLQKLMELDSRFTPELIGLMLRQGTMFDRNASAASYWLTIAATRDNSPEAQRALYEMYSAGDGVTRDTTQAEKWREALERNPRGSRNWEAEKKVLDDVTSGRSE